MIGIFDNFLDFCRQKDHNMQRIKIFTLLLGLSAMLFVLPVAAQRTNAIYHQYIKKYEDLAVDQMKHYRIPASITLAQALLESGAGRSELARKSNNHFGIKCGRSWRGKLVRWDDDKRNECFRAYRKVKESYVDHSKFLANRSRYAGLFSLKLTDYKGWAYGLKRAGYATSPTYAQRLIRIIETYKLYRYDRKAGRKEVANEERQELLAQASSELHSVRLCNDIAYVIAGPGDSYESLEQELEIKASKLRKYNEVPKRAQLQPGDVVFLHKKKRKAAKGCKIHVVQNGESMYTIAQLYGVRVKSLYFRNDMEYYEAVKVGMSLKLR